jgi:hypothetical protein
MKPKVSSQSKGSSRVTDPTASAAERTIGTA